jgi:hypothetical protein
MTQTLPGADIRGYYDALGISIPTWATGNASVSCFAKPDAHHRGDRDPSCSINLEHGAWKCHGCGAAGGAYDAATARGYSPWAAIDLMVTHGVVNRHPKAPGARAAAGRPARRTPPAQHQAHRPKLAVTEPDVRHWQAALTEQTQLIAKLTRERGWLYSTMLELGLGYDSGRITMPVRDRDSRLVGLLRYRPWPDPGQPKMLAAPGSRRALLPHPAAEPSKEILLVEGEPDMIAARSRNIPAIAVPGAETWRREWATLFAGREVTIAMDCDSEGRRAAERIAEDLDGLADARVFDIAPNRRDGYDLTDLLQDHPRLGKEILR